MNELPKFAVQRLVKPGEHSLVHPDADLLTAFLEHRITPVERDQVLAHLAHCSNCREVLALAAPDSPQAASASHGAAGVRTWLQWPGMRWVALAAACGVVAVVGLEVRNQPSANARQQEAAPYIQTETKQNPSVPTLSEPAKKPEMETRNETAVASRAMAKLKTAPSARAAVKNEKPQPVEAAREKQPSAPASESVEITAAAPAPSVLDGTVSGGRIGRGAAGAIAPRSTGTGRDQLSQNHSLDANTNPQQRRFVIQPQEAQNQVFAKQQQLADRFTADSRAVPAPPPPPSTATLSESPTSAVALADSAAPLDQDRKDKKDSNSITLGPSKRTEKNKAILPSLGAVGFGGGLYRTGTSPASKSYAGQASAWKISPEGKLLRKDGHEDSWHEIQLPVSATLHSLASTNRDVWVGGAPLTGEVSGALFHTTDGGEHWQQVKGPWAGDVIALQANSSQHNLLTVRTVAGEWQTQDAGVNWIRTR